MNSKIDIRGKVSKNHKGEGHRGRLRDRFLTSGLTGFHDYEVIELLLTLSTPRKDCKDAAKAALSRFQSLQGVFEASPQALGEIKGIGPKNILGLKLIQAVAQRYLQKRIIQKDFIRNSKEVFDYFYYSLSDRGRECFVILYLDAKNKILASEVLFEGTLTSSSVYPREVIRAALEKNAAAIICAHNHPSGDPRPSPADLSITRQLFFACQVMGIVLHEHLIIGENCYYSFADQGHIKALHEERKTESHPWMT